MLLDWGVDWHAQSEALRESRVGADEPPAYDLIIGRELVVVIEDLHERILYDYDEIARRRDERHIPHPVAFFKLAAHYEAIKLRGMLSEQALARLGVFGAATPDAGQAAPAPRVRGAGRLGRHAAPGAELALPVGTAAALLDTLVERRPTARAGRPPRPRRLLPAT